MFHRAVPDDGSITELPGLVEVGEGSLGGAGGRNPLAIGSAVVLLVAVWIGLQSQFSPDPGSAESVVPSVPASATPSHRAAKVPYPEPPGGPFSIAIGDVEVLLTLPAGWDAEYRASDFPQAYGSGRLGVATIDRLAGTCFDDELEAVEGAGASPQIAFVDEVPGIRSSAPVDFLLASYPGRYYEFFGRSSSCKPNALWKALAGAGAVFGAYNKLQLWVVNVGGTDIIFCGYTSDATPLEDLEEIRGIVASARFGPGPAADGPPTSTPRPVPSTQGVAGNGLPARQFVQVDGIGFSFEVPDSDWELRGDPAGTLSLNTSITGSQGAEAIVYWAPLEGGSQVHPCSSVLALDPVAPLAALGQAVASAPGTSVVMGPTPARVGGYPAAAVTLSVDVDLGCDPGYLYTWVEVWGGTLWTETSGGDTLRAWIVETPWRPLFIGGITNPNGEVLDDEIRSIVDSIDFAEGAP